jgi:ribosome assembly protein YihI (activator of Der GTPase)
LKQSNAKKNPYVGDKSNIPLTKTTKLLNKKFRTPMKEYQSPSIKDTYKDTDLDMRYDYLFAYLMMDIYYY